MEIWKYAAKRHLADYYQLVSFANRLDDVGLQAGQGWNSV